MIFTFFPFFWYPFLSLAHSRLTIPNNRAEMFIVVLYQFKGNVLLLLVSVKHRYIHCQGFYFIFFSFNFIFTVFISQLILLTKNSNMLALTNFINKPPTIIKGLTPKTKQ